MSHQHQQQHQHGHGGHGQQCGHGGQGGQHQHTMMPGTNFDKTKFARFVFLGSLTFMTFNFYSIFVHIYAFSLETAYLPVDGIAFCILWLLLFTSFLRGSFVSPGVVHDGWYKKYPQTHELLLKQYLLQISHLTKPSEKEKQVLKENVSLVTKLKTNFNKNNSKSAMAANKHNAGNDSNTENSANTETQSLLPSSVSSSDSLPSLLSSARVLIELPANYARPSRSNYSPELKVNILRLDHFCLWFNNAIGFYNYKYFYLCIFYLLWCSVLGIYIVMYRVFINPIGELKANGVGIWSSICLFLTVLSGLVFIVFSGVHLYMHTWQMVKGLTSLETQKFMHLQATATHFKLKFPNTHGYDHGCFRNFQNMLGYDFVFWCLPTNPCYHEDGYKFETNEEKKRIVAQFMKTVYAARESVWRKPKPSV